MSGEFLKHMQKTCRSLRLEPHGLDEKTPALSSRGWNAVLGQEREFSDLEHDTRWQSYPAMARDVAEIEKGWHFDGRRFEG